MGCSRYPYQCVRCLRYRQPGPAERPRYHSVVLPRLHESRGNPHEHWMNCYGVRWIGIDVVFPGMTCATSSKPSSTSGLSAITSSINAGNRPTLPSAYRTLEDKILSFDIAELAQAVRRARRWGLRSSVSVA